MEFERLRLRLRLAVGALVLVTAVGVLGFTLIGHGAHNIIDAIYMTVITLSTVGFGEIIDMSANPAGRVFTMVLLLGGMGVVAYAVPMLAAFMIEGHLNDIFARRRMEKTIQKLSGHYLVCGETPQSWYVAEELSKTARPVVVVAATPEALEEALKWLDNPPYVIGDPTDDATLLAANVTAARGAVFAMSNDKDNVLGVLAARRLAPRARIIAATERPETEAKLRSVGADAVVSPPRIGGLRMASELIRPHVVTFLDQMLRQDGGSLRVEEVTIPSEGAAGQTVAALRLDETAGAVLLALRHEGSGQFQFNPGDETRLEAGMTLVVMTDATGRQRLEERVRARS